MAAVAVWESRMFASLSHRNYRIYFTGALISNIGTWIQRVAQDWLVLELSHGSAAPASPVASDRKSVV